MVKLMDVSLAEFREQMHFRKLILYGGGYRAERICDYLNEPPIYIVDRNPDKVGKNIDTRWGSIKIVSTNFFIDYVKEQTVADLALLITPAYFALEIYEEISNFCELDGLIVYVMSLMIDTTTNVNYFFNNGEFLIPKKIHYCWFGDNNMPLELQKNIDGWKRICQDYEIIKWNESNYDISKNEYMWQAYQNKQWGFVPDYARLDILYNEGGFYFDTDVELISSLEPLRRESMFCAFYNEITIAIGTGIGAQKEHWMIKAMRDEYDKHSFINQDGSFNRKPCNYYQNIVFKENGFDLINSFQRKNGVTIFPTGLFISEDTSTKQTMNKQTIGIHHAKGSWHTVEENISLSKLKKHW